MPLGEFWNNFTAVVHRHGVCAYAWSFCFVWPGDLVRLVFRSHLRGGTSCLCVRRTCRRENHHQHWWGDINTPYHTNVDYRPNATRLSLNLVNTPSLNLLHLLHRKSLNPNTRNKLFELSSNILAHGYVRPIPQHIHPKQSAPALTKNLEVKTSRLN